MSTALMHDFIEPRERESVASEFYIYTKIAHSFVRDVVHLVGVARDIWVTEDGYRRFFELSEDDDLMGWWVITNKQLSEHISAVGRIFAYSYKPQRYRITIIDTSPGALMGHAIRN